MPPLVAVLIIWKSAVTGKQYMNSWVINVRIRNVGNNKDMNRQDRMYKAYKGNNSQSVSYVLNYPTWMLICAHHTQYTNKAKPHEMWQVFQVKATNLTANGFEESIWLLEELDICQGMSMNTREEEHTWPDDYEYEKPEKNGPYRVILSFLDGSFRHCPSFCDVLLKPLYLPISKAPWCSLHQRWAQYNHRNRTEKPRKKKKNIGAIQHSYKSNKLKFIFSAIWNNKKTTKVSASRWIQTLKS